MAKKILMISPPPVFPVIPEAGGPYIASFLKSQGFDIEFLDLGIRCFHRLKDESCKKNNQNGMDLKMIYQDLQKPQNNYEQYIKTVNEFEKSCLYHSQLHAPYGLGFYFIPSEYLNEDDRIKKQHPFLDYGKEIMDESGIENYDFVLFSVSQPKQFPITMELSKHIKSKNKNAVVIIGGAYVSVILDSIERKLFLQYFTSAFDHIDYMVPKLGELSIQKLLNKLMAEPLGGPDGYVLYREGGEIKILNNYSEAKLDDLPSPDFDGIDFSLYLTPKPIFPIRTSTRCYWGKCSFCRGNGNTFAEHLTFRQAHKVYEDMVYLHRKYDSPYFCFCEDATPPAMMTKLSKILIENGENFYWGTQGIRFEKSITEEDVRLWAKAGCKHLSFGLETGSQSLIEKINKGIILSKAAEIMKWCTENGIFTLCYALFGHPDETEDELFESIDFLDRNSKNIFTYSFCRYFLTPYQADYENYSKDEQLKVFFDNMIHYSNEIRYFGATKDYAMENWSKSNQTKMYKIYEKNDRKTKFLSYCGYNITLPSGFIKEELKNDAECLMT